MLVLHAYSAENAGDGLLVRETLSLIRDAFGSDTQITVAASHPETFVGLEVNIVDSSPGLFGYNRNYLRILRSMDEFDVVVGVGGGYIRAGYAAEAIKMLLVHGPQLLAASRTKTPSIYLPQSIGPAVPLLRRLLNSRLANVEVVHVRDDRSLAEFTRAGVTRTSDLAILSSSPRLGKSLDVDSTPVVSIRAVRGKVSPLVIDLARQVKAFDGYVQSETAGNNDVAAMHSIGPRRILPRQELMAPPTGAKSRVVVAVRLHAALMALQAGHFVIHLAYERKGFGAFEDLGLDNFVHNVNKFEPFRVVRQIDLLLTDETERARYVESLNLVLEKSDSHRALLIEDLRRLPGFHS
ncbi:MULTISPECIES: polysaccharide pyruvyl transferase family protein [unclassified Rhodococcus (in: high G+C Gram-positive bacteria)]|uniref:polysaccharide pyruvyl transferase family protein n=1 Tax=unclassified Rhodococcus (in: high G+C Gram-positive bacteria) TaxID=192944 RepID=UPI0005DF7870|nr:MULTISPECIES: polysaccharide pyruvyl transferase family protein [unclassified Rhodococcus (in: high G+C Gram-positive bacteria)]KJF23460.1 polysaccharide pyruvyl transferase CsaB [Rhodococcus sp. AD45]